MFVGVLALVFNALALFTHLLLATPRAFIAALAGLAMLRVLPGGVHHFLHRALYARDSRHFPRERRRRGNIQHRRAFLRLMFGFAVAWLLERADFRPRQVRF